MGQVTVITSGKGGTGKTTACAAISSCLVALGHRTLAIDCDMGLRNLDISLGMSDFAVADIADVAEGRIDLMDAVHEHPELPGLFFLSAPLYRPDAELPQESTSRLFDMARENFEYVLVDSPAGLGSGFRFAVRYADNVLIVATADPASVRNAGRAVETLRELGHTDIRLLLNKVDKSGWSRYNTTVDDIIDTTGARLVGIVREDVDVPSAASHESLLVLYSRGRASQGFLEAARRISGEEIPIS